MMRYNLGMKTYPIIRTLRSFGTTWTLMIEYGDGAKTESVYHSMEKVKAARAKCRRQDAEQRNEQRVHGAAEA